MLGPFDPAALSAGLLTSFAYDLIKNKAQASQHTLVGRMLRKIGFKEADFDGRLRETLTKTFALYLKEHPEYDLVIIGDFFRDAAVARQIGNFILDRQPIDEGQLQQLFEQYQHKDGYTISNLVLKNRRLTAKQIIDDFLQCYRRVLSEQLSVPEMGLLLDVFEQTEQAVQAIKDSEERLTQHITVLAQTTLSPAALQAAYQAGQQQLVASTATLVQTAQATQATAVQASPTPRLFADGLCSGRPLHPTPDHYFVSHGFTPEKLMDWRKSITETLANANHSAQPLQPYFSGDKLLSGYRFCGICERIYSTTFSLFLLPATQDRNVYLELGIAIGLGKPFFLIREHNAQIPPVLTSLAPYTYGGSFRTMRRELAEQIEEYDFAAVQFTQGPTNLQILPQYLIAAGESFDDEDFEEGIKDAIQKAYPQQQLTTFSLSQHLKQTHSFDLRQLVEQIQTARFAIYRVDEQSSPTTFLALGMSIGLNCPFIMLSQKGNEIPLNLRGLGIYQFANYTELERDMAKWHKSTLDKYAQ